MHHGSSNIDDTNFGHDAGLAGDEEERMDVIDRMKRSISQHWRVRAMRRAEGSRNGGSGSGMLVQEWTPRVEVQRCGGDVR